MRFYTTTHQYYCGIDLHARVMYLCIISSDGEIVLHRNMKADPESLLKAIEPYRPDIVVGVECIFTWYWIADICAEEGIPFTLGHALYMKAIHGGKAKNDRIDSGKITAMLKGGMFPMAYVYPAKMRATRDLLRRRNYLVRKRADLITHVQNTNSQYNQPLFGASNITHKCRRVRWVFRVLILPLLFLSSIFPLLIYLILQNSTFLHSQLLFLFHYFP
ncbi:MAG: transposase [Candidatus Aegiribacteria sp.]|nr:transposase [Candidatus Aegiribacteria sp.]